MENETKLIKGKAMQRSLKILITLMLPALLTIGCNTVRDAEGNDPLFAKCRPAIYKLGLCVANASVIDSQTASECKTQEGGDLEEVFAAAAEKMKNSTEVEKATSQEKTFRATLTLQRTAHECNDSRGNKDAECVKRKAEEFSKSFCAGLLKSS